jgi:diguanylate cyclase (GGDEF)-like protein
MKPKMTLATGEPVLSRLKTLTSPGQLRPFLLLGLLGFCFWSFSPVLPYDRIWSDLMLTVQQRPTPDQLLVISITPEDVIEHGTERLSRKYMAETLEVLAASGVKRVLLDFNFGGGLTKDEESALRLAMEKLGPTRLALAFEPDPINRTPQSLLAFAQTVNLALHTDSDGRMRSVVAEAGFAPNPCNWLAHGTIVESSTPLDLRFDSSRVRQLSLAELHGGAVSALELRDNLVIISLDRRVTRTRIYLPVVGESNRGTILALGTASSLSGYQRELESLAGVQLLLYLISLACGFLIGLRSPKLFQASMTSVGLAALIFFLALQFTFKLGVPSRPFSSVFISVVALKVALAHRLRVTELFLGLMSGVLSPEEVWFWRIYGDRAAPALLFDAMGHLKKANPAALELLNLRGFVNNGTTPLIAQQLIPSLGTRVKQISTHFGKARTWEIEWPSANLPLALLTDITERHEEKLNLQKQLQTDRLTGSLNRSGFEAELQTQVNRGEGAYAIYFLDMNGFKAVNDQLGHAAGDRLLKRVADRFRAILPPTDSLARFGGDEFAILVGRQLSNREAEEFREQIEATLEEPMELDGALVKVGVAAGFALPWSGEEAGTAVMERADLEMYRRKNELKSTCQAAVAANTVDEPSGRVTYE